MGIKQCFLVSLYHGGMWNSSSAEDILRRASESLLSTVKMEGLGHFFDSHTYPAMYHHPRQQPCKDPLPRNPKLNPHGLLSPTPPRTGKFLTKMDSVWKQTQIKPVRPLSRPSICLCKWTTSPPTPPAGSSCLALHVILVRIVQNPTLLLLGLAWDRRCRLGRAFR